MTSKMLVEWQGIFENVKKTSSKILQIGHLTGNEKNMAIVIDSIKQSSFFKKYLNNDVIPDELSAEAQNILKLFIANIKFKNKSLLQLQEYSHLLNTLPMLSKCVIANVIIQLDLTEHFCLLLLDLPIALTIEMLNEITFYLKLFLPEKRLEYTFAYLRTIIRIVIKLNDENNSDIIKLTTHFKDLMKIMAPFYITTDLNESEETKILQGYGYTLLYLFRLVQECSLENSKSDTLLLDLINACDAVLYKVSLDVYASWEEVSVDDISLQDAIAIEAYEIKKQLKDYDPAKEMLQKVCSARSRDEVIKNSMKTADTSTIVKNVNKADQYQKLWFQALLKSENVFDDTASIDCLSVWMKMCTREDVSIFMSHSKRGENCSNKKLILECIKTLNIADIQLLIQDYYHEHSISNAIFEMDNINGQITPLLNKITGTGEVEEDVMKNIYVLLLLNPQLILQTFCNRCLQNTLFITKLASLFQFIKSVPTLAECLKSVVDTTFLSNPISTTNFYNYLYLIKLTLNLECVSRYAFVSNILIPQVESLHQDEDVNLLYLVLQLINIIYTDSDDEIPLILFEILIKVIDSSRTSSVDFCFNKQSNLAVAIELLLKFNPKIKTARSNFTGVFSRLERKHELTKYYCALINGKLEKTFLEYYHKSFDIQDVHNMIVPLIMILTQSVAKEWKLIIEQIQSKLDNKSVMKMLTNTLQILCEHTAISPNNTSQCHNFEWCLDQYLVIIKEVFAPACNTKEDEYLLDKHIIYLVAYLGENFRSNGLQFIDLIPYENFPVLKDDRKLVLSLLTFKDEVLADIIAKKMLQ